ncbi:putative membrane protein [Pseudoxanthomonas sp. 3HH-4]|nr:putative membrane protein [Pseudoxanthomonas sp. 3HH-4]
MIKLSHARASFYLAAGAGVLAWGWALYAVPYLAVVVGVDVFFIAYLVRTLAAVPSFDAQRMRDSAGHRDEPLWLVLIITLAAAALAVILVISVGSKSERDAIVLVMTLASLPLAWATIHAMMAWHYAHMYWRKADKEDTDGSQTQDGYHGGLLFPGGKPPGARDFLYFSFVIGVAAQTADVSISSSRIRAVSLLHSLVAFTFNTVLLAAVVNVVVTLA